jgi:hypothetical protein
VSAEFGRLVYTDCRAGTGRGAGGGFQVQAQSADVDQAQSKMAVGWLLYEAPPAWIMERRPVEEFPLGFAHAAEAGYGTAQSRYVGTEATGARQGNHLADCLLTRDPDLYGPTRPVQLWRSTLWRADPWDSTECPQFEETPPLGPLTVDAVAGWVRDRPERTSVLTRLVSVLEDPGGPRVVIAAANPDEALRWIAAATLLLPVRVALDVSFKVFCTNHLRASHRIAGVAKDFNPQVVPGRGDSAFVLDAEQAICDHADISERARFWVQQFATASDPYDVVDAVELARALDPGAHCGGADAQLTAWAVTVPDSPLTNPPALMRWLEGADLTLRQEHGAEVVGRILTADPPAAELRWIDAEAQANSRIDALAVRSLLLNAEISEIRAGNAPPMETLREVDADASARRDADSELSSAIVLASNPQIDLLLRLARRHHIEPQLAPLRDRLGGFVEDWIEQVRARHYRPAEWARREEILDLTHEELRGRLTQQGHAEVMPTIQLLSRHFADRPAELADPLDCHIKVALLLAGPSKERPARLRVLLREACSGPRPEAAVDRIQRILILWRGLGPAEALTVLAKLPPTVPVAPEVLDLAIDEIERGASRPTAPMLDGLAVLDRRGLAPTVKPVADLLAADLDVRGFVEATQNPQFQSDIAWGRKWVKRLSRVEPTVTRARLSMLLRACLNFPERGLGSPVLSALRSSQPKAFIDLWSRELRGSESVEAAIEGLCWYADPDLSDDLRSHVADTFLSFTSALDPSDRDQWVRLLHKSISPRGARIWAQITSQETTRPHRPWRGRSKDSR